MIEESTFASLVQRVRAGDEQAATDLVRKYEPLVRREVRLHLEDRRLQRLFDSMDVCQSVMASFFLRMSAGQYDLKQPGQLVKLLVTMARNKLASAARRQNRQRRDHRRVAGGGADVLDQLAGCGREPGSVVAGRELLDQFRRGLEEEERQIVDLRAAGLAWAEVAAQLGGTPQARRMQLARAVERIARELNIDAELAE